MADKTRNEQIEERLRALVDAVHQTWGKNSLQVEGMVMAANAVLALPLADKTRDERMAELLASAELWLRAGGPTTNSDRFCVEGLCKDTRAELALPPDPPRGDGWEALRELRDWIADEANGRGFTVDTVFNRIDRLLAAAPKEPEPEPAESPVPAINMSGSGELSFDWWCGERNLTVFGENVTFLASHNAEPHEMIDGKVADLDHLRELQKWVADGGVVPQRGPQLDESPAEPAQDNSYRSLDHARAILRTVPAPKKRNTKRRK